MGPSRIIRREEDIEPGGPWFSNWTSCLDAQRLEHACRMVLDSEQESAAGISVPGAQGLLDVHQRTEPELLVFQPPLRLADPLRRHRPLLAAAIGPQLPPRRVQVPQRP